MKNDSDNMNENIKQFIETLQKWGSARAQKPARDNEIKARVLNTLPTESAKPVRRINWKLILLPIGAVAAVVLLISNNLAHKFVATDSEINAGVLSAPGTELFGLDHGDISYKKQATGLAATDSSLSIPRYPYPNQNNVPARDNREMLKISYNATIKARNVEEKYNRVENLIQDYDGRVDSGYSSKKYASISFVVPKSSFASFRSEVRELVGERFYIETTSRENKLPEKVAIEKETEATNNNLQSLEDRKDALIKSHNAIANSLRKQINGIEQEIAEIDKQLAANHENSVELNKTRLELVQKKRVLENKLSNENISYNRDLSNLNSQISYNKKTLENFGVQEQNLAEDVETVNGSIYFEWMSVYQYVWAYVGDFWPVLLILIPTVYLLMPRGREIKVS